MLKKFLLSWFNCWKYQKRNIWREVQNSPPGCHTQQQIYTDRLLHPCSYRSLWCTIEQKRNNMSTKCCGVTLHLLKTTLGTVAQTQLQINKISEGKTAYCRYIASSPAHPPPPNPPKEKERPVDEANSRDCLPECAIDVHVSYNKNIPTSQTCPFMLWTSVGVRKPGTHSETYFDRRKVADTSTIEVVIFSCFWVNTPRNSLRRCTSGQLRVRSSMST